MTRDDSKPRLAPDARSRFLARARRAERSADRLRESFYAASANGAPTASLDAINARADAAASLAARLRLAADASHCADCGAGFPVHPPGYVGGTGYATLCGERDPMRGARVCYPCADARERSDFEKAERFGCYLSRREGGGLYLSTWTGGFLARVVSCWTRRVGFGWRTERTYFNAIAPDGSAWHGTALGVGMLARARRSKPRRRAKAAA